MTGNWVFGRRGRAARRGGAARIFFRNDLRSRPKTLGKEDAMQKSRELSVEDFEALMETSSEDDGIFRTDPRYRPRSHAKGSMVHVTSRCILQASLLKDPEAKEIVACQLLFYARVFGVEVVHYCFMDNHLHILLRFRRKTMMAKLADMLGRVKQVTTNRLKRWFNTVFRLRSASNRKRRKMGKGTLWDDRYHLSLVRGLSGVVRCTLYVECNRIARQAKRTRDLEAAKALIAQAARNMHQSLGYWLTRERKDLGALTNGTDINWADRWEEMEYRNTDPPPGWRWVKYGRYRLVRPTPLYDRKPPRSDVADRCSADVLRDVLVARVLAA